MNADIDMLRHRKSPAKSLKRWCESISCIIEGVYTVGLCISRFLIHESLFCVKKENLGSKRRRQNLQWHLAPNKKSGKKGSIARDYPKVWTSWAWSLLAKIGERSHEETLQQERCTRRVAWDLANIFSSSRMRTKLRFILQLKQGKCKRPEEREQQLIQEHQCTWWAKQDLSSDELDTLRRSRNPTVMLTASGEVHTNEEAQIFVHNLDLFVIVAVTGGNASSPITGKTLRRPRILLWVGQRSKTTVDQRGGDNWMQNGQLRTFCRSSVIQIWERFAGNIDTAGLVVNKSSSVAKWRTSPTKVVRINLPKTKTKMDDKKDADDPLADLPILLEDFTDNLEATEVHAPAHMSHYSDSERPTKVVSKSRKHSTCTHFQRPKLRSLLANQNDQSSSQNSHLAKFYLEHKSLVTW